MDLGLSDAEFWHSTFREFHALLQRRKSFSDRADLRAGLIAASLFNAQRASEQSHFFEPSDFFPNLRVADEEAPPVRVLDKFKSVLADMGVPLRRVTLATAVRPVEPLRPLSALPSREAIEAKLAGLAS